MACGIPLHQVRGLRCRGGGRLPVPGLWWATVTRDRSRAAGEALQVLALFAQHAPAPARDQFLAALRGRGLREPYDSAAAPDAVPAWRRPDWYVVAFAEAILPTLGAAERALAMSAIDAMPTPSTGRRARPSPEMEAGQP